MRYDPSSIEEQFQITGRGLVVVVSVNTELPTGRAVRATLHLPDGSTRICEAFKEWILRRNAEPLEKEGFFLPGLTRFDVPTGTLVELEDN